MDLRQPHMTSESRPAASSSLLRVVIMMQSATLAVVGGLAGMHFWRTSQDTQHNAALREVASQLNAAGVAGEASKVYEQYLQHASLDKTSRANLAFALGNLLFDVGQYEEALRWYYDAQQNATKDNAQNNTGEKIVHALEKLGHSHAAQSALESQTSLSTKATSAANDPVVAQLGNKQISKSAVMRALDDLPPELSKEFSGPDKLPDFLRKYVVDELLLQKATKHEMANDPDVRRRIDAITRQVIVAGYLEKEVIGKITVDASDVENYFKANKDKYQSKTGNVSLADVRAQVERDLRWSKVEEAYKSTVEQELAVADVKLYPERLTAGAGK